MSSILVCACSVMPSTRQNSQSNIRGSMLVKRVAHLQRELKSTEMPSETRIFPRLCLNTGLEPPDFRFSETKKHKDALGRMVHEAVLIGSKATMNSKAEWMEYRVARLSVEMTDKEAKESVETSEGVDRHEKALLARVATNCSPSTNSNPYFDSR